MSWTKTVNLECDGGEHGCMWTPDHPENDESVDEARDTARKHGWGFVNGQDLCPICRYVRRTGCTCEVQVHEGGEVVPLTDPHAVRGCKVHDPALRRNSGASGR